MSTLTDSTAHFIAFAIIVYCRIALPRHRPAAVDAARGMERGAREQLVIDAEPREPRVGQRVAGGGQGGAQAPTRFTNVTHDGSSSSGASSPSRAWQVPAPMLRK